LSSPAAAKGARKVTAQFGTYAAFMSFFGLAQLPAASPAFYGIVDYASCIVFELVTNSTDLSATELIDPSLVSVRFLFSNGTAGRGAGLEPFPLFGQQDLLLPWTAFVGQMNAFSIGNTTSWCTACGNSTGPCADAVGSSSSGGSNSGSGSSSAGGSGGGVSRPVAGAIGALVTLIVVLGIEGLVMAVAGLRVVRKGAAASGKTAGAEPAASS